MTNTLSDLRALLPQVNNPETRAFIGEAISCAEADLLRAAVVLSWVGAVNLLYDYVFNNRLADFNREAQRRNAKWKPAAITDDLVRMKEHDFLDVIEAISVIGKNVKQELQNNCLNLRNACGHPNSLKIGANRVAAHLESLLLNVYSQF
ncbi:MAG: hypothetical protein KC519_15000 [Anaerolineae bacterium]|nr:hypothetical protein [Anaerolineae bacterium]